MTPEHRPARTVAAPERRTVPVLTGGLQLRRTTDPRPAPPRPVHDARALTGAGNQAEIVLDGSRYVLRITRQGKLILTK